MGKEIILESSSEMNKTLFILYTLLIIRDWNLLSLRSERSILLLLNMSELLSCAIEGS